MKNPEIENKIQILFLLTLLTLPRREWNFAGVFFEAPASKILQSFKMALDTQDNQPLFQWTQAGLSSLQTEIEAWVTKEKGYHEVVKEKETSWMSNVQPSVVKPHGVSPKSFDGQYAWANEGANIVSVDEHTALYHAQFVID